MTEFVGYLTADENTAQMALALVEGGVTVLEIGIPFSDPVADGPVIQRAADEALSRGMTPRKVLSIVQEIRKKSDVPIYLFTYFNPLLSSGRDYLEEAKEAGVTGVLVVDLPVDEGEELRQICDHWGLHCVFIAAPSSSDERLEKIGKLSTGFIYYACQKGTTGVRDELPEDIEWHIARIKKHSDLPVYVGFGISNRAMSQQVAKVGDGFVVGSLFVQGVLDGKSGDEMTQLARSLT